MTGITQLHLANAAMAIICRVYGVTSAELCSHAKTARVVWPRHCLIHLLTKHTCCPTENIAYFIGHTRKGVNAARRALAVASPCRRAELDTLSTLFTPIVRSLLN